MLLKGGGACLLLFLVGVVDERDRDSNDKPKRLGLLLLVLLLVVVVVDGRSRDANKNPPLLELLLMMQMPPVLLANGRSICPVPPVAYVIHGHRCERVRVMLDTMGGLVETYTKRIRASIIARAEQADGEVDLRSKPTE